MAEFITRLDAAIASCTEENKQHFINFARDEYSALKKIASDIKKRYCILYAERIEFSESYEEELKLQEYFEKVQLPLRESVKKEYAIINEFLRVYSERFYTFTKYTVSIDFF